MARQVLQSFEILCGIFGFTSARCCTQPANSPRLFCAFLTCATEAVPLFGLPHRCPGAFQACNATLLLPSMLQAAAMSVCIPEVTPEVRFQSVGQDLHAGIACFLA